MYSKHNQKLNFGLFMHGKRIRLDLSPAPLTLQGSEHETICDGGSVTGLNNYYFPGILRSSWDTPSPRSRHLLGQSQNFECSVLVDLTTMLASGENCRSCDRHNFVDACITDRRNCLPFFHAENPHHFEKISQTMFSTVSSSSINSHPPRLPPTFSLHDALVTHPLRDEFRPSAIPPRHHSTILLHRALWLPNEFCRCRPRQRNPAIP
jgi:hypothetical protein